MSQVAGKELSALGTRPVFNKTLRHLVSVTSIIDAVEKGQNIADVLNGMVESGSIGREQLAPILSVVLVDKLGYVAKSRNLFESYSTFQNVIGAFKKWNGVDMVVAYHQPDFGLIPINPSNSSHWDILQELKKDELIVVYSQVRSKNKDTARKAIDAFFELLHGKVPQEVPEFIDQDRARKEQERVSLEQKQRAAAQVSPAPVAAPQAAPVPAPGVAPVTAAAEAPKGPMNKTPMYGVQVTNELFHNGNVEAWKNIIESFHLSHPGCKVIVYYERELIKDLNSLFKWGKVKHGGVISFMVIGPQIKNVSRLQKYLFEGASNRFEAFMKKDVNKALNLF